MRSRPRGEGGHEDFGRGRTISAATLPSGYSFEWTGTALQEKAASGRTGTVLGLAVLFAYLFLVALYESWNIPISVLLSVSVGVLGAIVSIVLPPGSTQPSRVLSR